MVNRTLKFEKSDGILREITVETDHVFNMPDVGQIMFSYNLADGPTRLWLWIFKSDSQVQEKC